MNAKKILAHVWDYVVLTVGIVAYCLSWTSFLIPNGIASGGGTGLCTIIFFATGIPVSASFFILNAILLILGFLALGKAFGVKTIYAIILSTVLFDVLPKLDWVITFDDKLLIAVVGGIIEALGIGLVLLRGGSTGGTDIAAMIVNKYWPVSPGKVYLFSDIFIIASVLLIPGKTLEDMIYGYVVMVTFSFMVDFVLLGQKSSAQVLIFSSKYKEIADSISILRDGKIVHTGNVADITMEEIITHMMGEGRGKKFEWIPREYDKNGKDLLTVEHLKVNSRIADISFGVKKGEILGLAGLMGSGRTEILETLFGLRKAHGGTVKISGGEVVSENPRQAIKNGFALIPEDRRKQGLVLIHSVKENAILPKLSGLLTNGVFVDEKKADAMVLDNVEKLNIVTDDIHKRIGLLSGGNQQKVVLAKWMNMHPKVMMLDEPTAGVDVGAKAEIIALMREYADQGNGVLFVSSELAELMAVCDRIITIYDGKITGEIDRSELETEEVLQYAIQQK